MPTNRQTIDHNHALATLAQRDGRYVNHAPMLRMGFFKMLRVMYRTFFKKPRNTRPAVSIPLQPLSRQQLLAAPDNTVYRLGHSTVLLKLRGKYWLTDPVFAQRASPVQWAGPKRFHEAPVSLEELPPLEAVILSHNHYDHLDYQSILALMAKTEHFLAPLGVGQTLIEWGVPAHKVHELNWWEATEVSGIQFVATPAQHFSGRSLSDANRSLWASWVILDDQRRIFFSGDTGYHAGFKAIGEQYGPFDLCLMETGAYDVDWPDVHMQPEESLQAHLDVRGQWLLPIHNGTFDLAMHAWYEPMERIVALAQASGVQVTTPQIGEPFYLDCPNSGSAWWAESPASAADVKRPRRCVAMCRTGTA